MNVFKRLQTDDVGLDLEQCPVTDDRVDWMQFERLLSNRATNFDRAG